MIAREIHDPKVLELIFKECDFMISHSADSAIAEAYRQMSIAARKLRYHIQARHHKYKCRACGRQIGLCQNGTYRVHSTNHPSKEICWMSGKPIDIPDGYEHQSFPKSKT